MEELVRPVSRRAGISEEQARLAVETELGLVKERLPAPVAGQIDGGLGVQAGGGLGEVAGNLGGFTR